MSGRLLDCLALTGRVALSAKSLMSVPSWVTVIVLSLELLAFPTALTNLELLKYSFFVSLIKIPAVKIDCAIDIACLTPGLPACCHRLACARASGG